LTLTKILKTWFSDALIQQFYMNHTNNLNYEHDDQYIIQHFS